MSKTIDFPIKPINPLREDTTNFVDLPDLVTGNADERNIDNFISPFAKSIKPVSTNIIVALVTRVNAYTLIAQGNNIESNAMRMVGAKVVAVGDDVRHLKPGMCVIPAVLASGQSANFHIGSLVNVPDNKLSMGRVSAAVKAIDKNPAINKGDVRFIQYHCVPEHAIAYILPEEFVLSV